MPKTSSFDLPNFLLGLAWLGELDREQVRSLWFPERSASTVEKRLAQLRQDGLIQARNWSLRIGEKTVPQLARWGLTVEGHAQIKALDQYPLKPVKPRRKELIQHDARTTRVVVQMILWARSQGLSSVCVLHEVRLDPATTRPVADALLIIQVGAPPLEGHLVPWSRDPAIADERRWRLAVEADNDTEAASVIRGKALAYRRMIEDREWRTWWRQQYGPPPMPIWVAPTFERCRTIHNQWHDAWPGGDWLITDDEGLDENYWYACIRGKVKRNQSVSFAPPAPALPAPAPAAPAQAAAPASLPAPATQQQAQVAPPTPRPAPAPAPPPAPQAVLTYAPPPARPPAPAPRLITSAAPFPGIDRASALAPPRQLQSAPPVERRRSAFDWYGRLEGMLFLGLFAFVFLGLFAFLFRAGDVCGVTRASAGATLAPAPGVFGGQPLSEGVWFVRSCVEPQRVGLDTWTPVYRAWPEGSGWMVEREVVTP